MIIPVAWENPLPLQKIFGKAVIILRKMGIGLVTTGMTRLSVANPLQRIICAKRRLQ